MNLFKSLFLSTHTTTQPRNLTKTQPSTFSRCPTIIYRTNSVSLCTYVCRLYSPWNSPKSEWHAWQPLVPCTLMGRSAVVIWGYRGQSDVAGDGECRFTRVETSTAFESTRTNVFTVHIQRPCIQSKHIRTHLHRPKPVGNFIEHKEQ